MPVAAPRMACHGGLSARDELTSGSRRARAGGNRSGVDVAPKVFRSGSISAPHQLRTRLGGDSRQTTTSRRSRLASHSATRQRQRDCRMNAYAAAQRRSSISPARKRFSARLDRTSLGAEAPLRHRQVSPAPRRRGFQPPGLIRQELVVLFVGRPHRCDAPVEGRRRPHAHLACRRIRRIPEAPSIRTGSPPHPDAPFDQQDVLVTVAR